MRVFVGSSSQAKQSGDLDAVCKLLRNAGPGLELRPWADPESFFLNTSTWEFLLAELAEVDAAAFIFREDDQIRRPDGKLVGMTRDNVVLEFGLFTGALTERARTRFKQQLSTTPAGERSCAIFVRGCPWIPTDLRGITIISLAGGVDNVEVSRKTKAWAATISNQNVEPYRLRPNQTHEIVQAMKNTKIPPKVIYHLMARLHVGSDSVDAAFRGSDLL